MLLTKLIKLIFKSNEYNNNILFLWQNYLHSMVLLVTNVNEPQRVRGDSPRVAEFAIGRSVAAERAEEIARRIENLYSMIVSV